jgi:hypothetical protein
MKISLAKLFLLNVLTGIVLFFLLVFFSVSLYEYGSVDGIQENRLFIGFAISHLILNGFLLHKYNLFNRIFVLITTLLILALYFLEAWHFDYFK